MRRIQTQHQIFNEMGSADQLFAENYWRLGSRTAAAETFHRRADRRSNNPPLAQPSQQWPSAGSAVAAVTARWVGRRDVD